MINLFTTLNTTVAFNVLIKTTFKSTFMTQNINLITPALKSFNFFTNRDISTNSQITVINSEEKNSKGLHPFFVTGFADGESSFSILISEYKRMKIGWQVKAEFQICLHSKDVEILYKIQEFFKGIGNISIKSNRDVAQYRINDINSIKEILIPHFEKYPLQSAKSVDFLIFKQCVNLIANKEHLNKTGLEQIIANKAGLNLGLPDKLKIAFPHVKLLTRPEYIPSEDILDPLWISGFVNAEGSFLVSFYQTGQINAVFSIGLNERDLPLLKKIQSFFEIGNINKVPSNNAVHYRVSAISELNTIIISHFERYPLSGVKLNNFLIWHKIVILIYNKLHLTEEGLVQLKFLRSTLNKY